MILAWEGCGNVRDLGGLPTEDGTTTQPGAIVRADRIRLLSATGWTALLGHGVRTIVDLRSDEELLEDSGDVPPVDVVRVPLFGQHWQLEEARATFMHEMETTDDIEAALSRMYLERLDRNITAFGSAVTAVARARDGGVCIHCHAGVDRTGVLAALLLRIAGVPIAAVAADYAASAPYLRRTLGPWIGEADGAKERAWRERRTSGNANVMVDVLDALEAQHGNVETYLLSAGATPEDLATARRRLRSGA
jgi:protein tyrosine/serine phosphatase